MKRKIIGIFVCILVVIGSAFTVMALTGVAKQRLVTQSNSNKQVGTILITEYYYGNRVIEVDSGGTIVWQKAGLNWPFDAERLENGNTLITEYGLDRVIEVDGGGTIVWQKAGLNDPYDAERLANGNTLITDTGNNRVIEVDSGGTIVWQKAGLNTPIDAERLATGNTLITEIYNTRVIEVNSGGTIVWQKAGLDFPIDAERLENGNTLITESGRVIEVDSSGNLVWQKAGLNEPFDAERISDDSPDAPIIDGPSKGQAGIKLCWTFLSEDPNDDLVKYFIQWGDGTSNETDFNSSGVPVEVCHIYTEQEEYTITAYAEDETGLLSEESTLTVTIPRPRVVYHPLLLRLFERFPNAFPILRQLLGL